MNADEMSKKIMEYIGSQGDASFANLMNLFGKDAEANSPWKSCPTYSCG